MFSCCFSFRIICCSYPTPGNPWRSSQKNFKRTEFSNPPFPQLRRVRRKKMPGFRRFVTMPVRYHVSPSRDSATKKRHGVRSCRMPCLELLVTQSVSTLILLSQQESSKGHISLTRRLRCLQPARRSVCQPDMCQPQVRARSGYRYTGSYRFGSWSLYQRYHCNRTH